jgi:hypoxanthine phosphoribosyltransferase
LIKSEEISEKAREIASYIKSRYSDRPYFLVVLKGSFYFFNLLSLHMMSMSSGFDVAFVTASSYQGTSRSDLNIRGLDLPSLEGRDVIVVEDIVDSGATVGGVINKVREGGPKSVLACTMLTKRNVPRVKGVDEVEIVAGFEVDDEFVVGAGLDVNEWMRDVQDLYVLNDAGIKEFAT